MKLYTFDAAPNARRVALFMQYKGIEIDTTQIAMMELEQLGDDYKKINPECTVPALVLDDGTVLTEVVGICAYLEVIYPDKPLMGGSALEKALVISWDHKLFMGIMSAIASILRNTSKGFVNRGLPGPLDLPQIPELAERGRLQIPQILAKLNEHLANNQWVAGDNFSLADIDLMASIDFMAWVKQSVPDECVHLKNWRERADAVFA
jgi:glutathione S-transferase